MTSYERSGNNTYNGTSSPKYGILTYTWGRWQAPDGSPALPVKGTTWAIPPVKEERFSVEAFQRVVDHIGKELDWVWIDVCCIDQENADVKMSEIKRQVGIFYGARKAYVWLHSLSEHDLERVVEPIHELERLIEDSEQLSRSLMRSALDALRELFSDPWFTSLWTLQEATLRRDANILSRDAVAVMVERQDDWERPLELSFLVLRFNFIFNHLADALRENILPEDCREDAQEIQRAIQKSGLNFYNARNPNVVYGAAQHRQTRDPADRIYGIMAIFRIKASASLHPTTNLDTVALSEVQDMFATTLNNSSPIGGQCFVHLGVPEDGKSWRITQHSAVPGRLQQWDLERFVHASSIQAMMAGYAVLRGDCCPLAVLWAYWSKMNIRGTTWLDIQLRYKLTIGYDHAVRMMLPEDLRTEEMVCEETEEDFHLTRTSLAHHQRFKVTRHLMKTLPPKDLLVFRLGHRDLTIASIAAAHPDHDSKPKGDDPGEACPQVCRIQDPSNLAANEELIELGSHPSECDTGGKNSAPDEVKWGLRWNRAIEERKESFGVIVYRYPDGKHRRIGICAWDDDNALPHELVHSSIRVY